MASVLLISCNTTTKPYPVYPLGMAFVAQATRDRGHEVTELDLLCSPSTPEFLEQTVRDANPDLIGLSIRNVDNTDSCEYDSYTAPYVELVAELRKLTKAPIVLGGAGFSLYFEPLMDATGADYGILGEGELQLADLAERISADSPPARGILERSRACDLTNNLVPSRDPELAAFYLNAGGMLNVQAKRGCPHRCAYCSYPLLEGDRYRFRSPAVIVDEIEMLICEHKADYLAFTDSAFNDAQGHYLEIAREIVRRNIRVPWMAFFRPQRFAIEEVDLLKRSGLSAVEWGTDCTSDETLRQMQKDFTFEEVIYCNRLFAEAGVSCAHFVIFGGPGESEATVREGLDNLNALDKCVVFAFLSVRILPGTKIQELAIEAGMISKDDPLIEPRFYFSPEIGRDRVDELISASFKDRPDRIYPPHKGSERIELLHKMGHRGPIWNLLLRDAQSRRRRRV